MLIVKPAKLRGFLNQLRYPLYFLDYETLTLAVPLFAGTRPHQQIPFQFSLHVQDSPNAELAHYEHLHQERSDPRHPFTEQLIRLCNVSGSIIVYNQSFEKNRNEELAVKFAQHTAALQAINDRMVDLLVPFRRRWLYHPAQKGSASLKAVLPAFTRASYDHLAISNGRDASRQYGNFMQGNVREKELPLLWHKLKEYCKQDTYAMIMLLDVVQRYAHG